VAVRHRLPFRVLVGERRTVAYCLARDEAWAEAYATGKFSQSQIAKVFNRHTSSICDGIQRHKEREAAAKAFKPRAA
jgi:IS30 family transposase